MRLPEFEALVSEALEGLPEAFKEHLENVEVLVQNFPTREQMRANGMSNRYDMFGLYEGVPLTDRGGAYDMVLPDKITIFKGPLEAAFRTEEELASQVQETVVHELAHHFGMTDEQLDEIGHH